jgi:regulator of replication initiation timing
LHDTADLEQRNAAKLEKAKQVVELRDAKIEELQQTLKEKIAMVTEKKDLNVSATKYRASLKNEHVARKAAEVQKIRDQELKILDASLSEKLNEGFRRSQEYLSKRSEKVGNRARTGSKSSNSFDTPLALKISSDSNVSFEHTEDFREEMKSSSAFDNPLVLTASSNPNVSAEHTKDLGEVIENKFQPFELIQVFSLLVWNGIVSFFSGFNVKAR